MFWTEEKLAARVKELEEFRYRDKITISSFRCQEDKKGEVGARPSDAGEWSTIRIGDYWTARDAYLWMTAEVDIPKDWAGKEIAGRFDFGRSSNSEFEALLFVEGEPYQGVDTNHKEVLFPREYAGSTVSLQFRLWSGLEGGGKPTPQEHKLRLAEISWLDEAADDLYFTGKAAIETVSVLKEGQPERQALLKALNRSFLKLDWSRPGSEGFYTSILEARSLLRSELQQIRKDHEVTVRCIGHTHIDVAWLWRLKHTREKAARSFSTVLRLMEKYPDYIFLQTQPQLYEYIKSDYPEIFEQIRARVKENRWEAGGGMWLEADCNLTSGESLVRQLLYGTRFLRQEFGVECSYLWLPDVFGYSWALPQILKKSGIETFMTTKISWNQYNRMPHDTFNWRGLDGSEVLAHFITTPEVPESNFWWYTYNGRMEPYSIRDIWENYRDKNLNQELLISYGYGDGGGGVTREMLEMRRRLDELPGLPNVVTGRADEYFSRLQDTVKDSDQYVHTWDGEFYLEYHRGTYTSQAYIKRMNRKLELKYRDTEWMQVFRAAADGSWKAYPGVELGEGWKIILRNQFHDIIPGSSIQEVYEDAREEYDQAERIANRLWDEAAGHLTSGTDGRAVTVFNSASFARTDIVEFDAGAFGSQDGVWEDLSGQQLDAQRDGDRWAVRVAGVPAFGCQTISFRPEDPRGMERANSPFHYYDSKLVTPFYEIKWNEAGQLQRIYDKEAGREVLPFGERCNVLQVFEDKPKMFDAWDVDIYYQEKMREVNELQSIELVSEGMLKATFRFVWKYMDSRIEQHMTVYRDSKRIDFETKVDWHEKQQLLKVSFPVEVRTTEATFDIQFGNVKRPTHWNTSWDLARFETVGHQWVDLSERGFGVSLLNDCKYGHDVKNNVIRLSLIKSAVYPDPDADQGEHRFTYSLLPHMGDWVDGHTVQEAWSLNNPMITAYGYSTYTGQSLFQIDNPHVMVDAVKKAEDSNQIVLRLHENTGSRGKVRLASLFGLADWQEADLLERPIGPKQIAGFAEFDIKPYEIKTLLLTLQMFGNEEPSNE